MSSEVSLQDYHKLNINEKSLIAPVHSPPVPVGQYNADESAIWTFNPTTYELKGGLSQCFCRPSILITGKSQAHYVNINGHKAKTTIAYKIYDNSIFFVGDIGAYNAAQVDPDYLVSPIVSLFNFLPQITDSLVLQTFYLDLTG
jgi:hypothetical protein